MQLGRLLALICVFTFFSTAYAEEKKEVLKLTDIMKIEFINKLKSQRSLRQLPATQQYVLWQGKPIEIRMTKWFDVDGKTLGEHVEANPDFGNIAVKTRSSGNLKIYYFTNLTENNEDPAQASVLISFRYLQDDTIDRNEVKAALAKQHPQHWARLAGYFNNTHKGQL